MTVASSRSILALLALALVTACSDFGQSITPRATSGPRPSVVAPDGSLSMAPGETFALPHAFATLPGGHCGPSSVSWSSSNPAIATVTNAGLVTAIAPGTATLTARSCGRVSTTPIVVGSVPAGGTPVSPVSPSPGPTPPPVGSMELPRTFLDTRSVAPAGRTLVVNRGDDLQRSLNAAQPGDLVVLQAGATFTGNFVLPRKGGAGWITIRSSADASLPAEGTRISPRFADVMPRIVSPNVSCAITAPAGSSGYRIVGVEITTTSAKGYSYGLVCLGEGSEKSLSDLPSDLILDRVYVHGTANIDLSRCIALNGARNAVIDSWISECHGRGYDTQAIAGWNGSGPFKITNNYLEGAGENVMFGGADPKIQNLIPSDIEFRRNHVAKPLSWRGVWTVKNSFELKNARRVLVEGNVFENNWSDAQDGFAIVLKSMNQDYGCPWCGSSQVTFRLNKIMNSPGGVNFVEQLTASNGVPVPLTNVLLQNNLFLRIGAEGVNGRLFQLTQLVRNVVIDHNTGFTPNQALVLDTDQKPGFVMTNNLVARGQYGVFGSGGAEGTSALDAYCPGWVFQRNVVIGASLRLYPAGNFYPATSNDVGFANYAGGDYRLTSASPYRSAGTDGRDVGADIAAVELATAGVVTPP
ncbi:MAG: Ig-like domain-containing protein [Gemmatimonadota bacterium]|nr:Ig-like domain-containing protein [Gemmatimonadota bacterium]